MRGHLRFERARGIVDLPPQLVDLLLNLLRLGGGLCRRVARRRDERRGKQRRARETNRSHNSSEGWFVGSGFGGSGVRGSSFGGFVCRRTSEPRTANPEPPHQEWS